MLSAAGDGGAAAGRRVRGAAAALLPGRVRPLSPRAAGTHGPLDVPDVGASPPVAMVTHDDLPLVSILY